jgi:hypothetical protein
MKKKKLIKKLKERNKELKDDCESLNLSFDMRWKADMKAIKRWQEETGRDLVWPDHQDLCVWLLNKLKEQK